MADYDIYNDVLPKRQNNRVNKPTIAQLKSAISGSGVSASYPAAKMMQMTENDLINICRLHSITVNTTL